MPSSNLTKKLNIKNQINKKFNFQAYKNASNLARHKKSTHKKDPDPKKVQRLVPNEQGKKNNFKNPKFLIKYFCVQVN